MVHLASNCAVFECPLVRRRACHLVNLPDSNVQKMGVTRLFQDGEGGIIDHIMNTSAGTMGEIVEGKPSCRFAKGPNAQTEGWQVNDISDIHPTVQEGFKSEEFSCLSKESVQMIIDENTGLIPALQSVKKIIMEFVTINGIFRCFRR
jgi:hypothetical protein